MQKGTSNFHVISHTSNGWSVEPNSDCETESEAQELIEELAEAYECEADETQFKIRKGPALY